MRTTILIAISALTMGAVPALAQDTMMKKDSMQSGQMTMSATEMKKMKSCQAMSHEKMMKNAGCARMMKMHPDMMKSDGMMKKSS